MARERSSSTSQKISSASQAHWKTSISNRSKIRLLQYGVLAFFLFLMYHLYNSTSSHINIKDIISDEKLDRIDKLNKGLVTADDIEEAIDDVSIPHQLENATFVMLVRNEELGSAINSIIKVEKVFNHKYHYPWTFLNDVPFTDAFIKETSAVASGNSSYGLIATQDWEVPIHVDMTKAREEMAKMQAASVIYGGSLPYRKMCRYNSGGFYRHELTLKYDYYWRVEPGVEFYCDIDYDVFKFMRVQRKKYGFVISLREYEATIPTLWDTVADFVGKFPQYLAPNNSLGFIADLPAEAKDIKSFNTKEGLAELKYNLCHFWSNFEIGDMRFFRSEAYSKYFDFLDQKGGFFYERWGDAPVHSIAAALFLNQSDVHFFDDIGYWHVPFTHCSIRPEIRAKCNCDVNKNFDWHGYSCTRQWHETTGLEFPLGWEKQKNY